MYIHYYKHKKVLNAQCHTFTNLYRERFGVVWCSLHFFVKMSFLYLMPSFSETTWLAFEIRFHSHSLCEYIKFVPILKMHTEVNVFMWQKLIQDAEMFFNLYTFREYVFFFQQKCLSFMKASLMTLLMAWITNRIKKLVTKRLWYWNVNVVIGFTARSKHF